MATLEKIRQRGVLLTCIIGLALFLFIFTGVDFNSLFGESRTLVGEVNGTKIEIAEFEQRVEEAKAFFQIERGENSLDEQTTSQIRETVWNMWLQEVLYGQACEDAGITVSDEELAEQILSDNPNPMLNNLRLLFNPNTNRFDKNILVQLLQIVDQEPTSDYAKYWAYVERNIRLQLLENKYNTLVVSAINYNDADAKALYNAKKAANIEYVQVPYYNQPDSLFPVTDAELKEYYNKNINAFNQKEEQRVIKVLSFAITPSAQDYAETEAWINDLKNDFATSADYVAINNQNSDVPYQGIAVSEKNVDADLKAFAFSGKAGDVFGPTLFGNTYKMARIVETGILAPDSVKVRHILVQDADAAKTQKLADSIVAALKAGADFATVAKEYSLAGTAQNGGELGWFKEGEIDLEFSKACFAAKPKEIFTFPMGGAIQIAQVTETTKPVQKVKLCVLQRKVEAGSQTYGAIYGQASAYIAQNNTATAFVDSAKADQGLYIRTYTIGKNDARVGNLEDSRQVVRWAFDKKAGNVTEEVYECGKNFVVAMVDQVIPAGTKSFEMVKTQVKAAVIQGKKGDKIIEDMKAAGDNLAALGAVASAQNVSLSSTFIPNIGREPMVAGCIPTLLATKQVQYVKGSIGVFAIRLVSEVPQGEFNAAAEITEYTNRNPFVYTTFESLKNSAEIIDNRINFY